MHLYKKDVDYVLDTCLNKKVVLYLNLVIGDIFSIPGKRRDDLVKKSAYK